MSSRNVWWFCSAIGSSLCLGRRHSSVKSISLWDGSGYELPDQSPFGSGLGGRLKLVPFGLVGVSQSPVLLRRFCQLFSKSGLRDLSDRESRAVAWPWLSLKSKPGTPPHMNSVSLACFFPGHLIQGSAFASSLCSERMLAALRTLTRFPLLDTSICQTCWAPCLLGKHGEYLQTGVFIDFSMSWPWVRVSKHNLPAVRDHKLIPC